MKKPYKGQLFQFLYKRQNEFPHACHGAFAIVLSVSECGDKIDYYFFNKKWNSIERQDKPWYRYGIDSDWEVKFYE